MNRWVAALQALLGLSVPACGSGNPSVDASSSSDAAVIADAGGPMDGAPSLSFVDFAITGCDDDATMSGMVDAGPADGGVVEPCRGAAPLTLGFTAVAPAAIDVYAWMFGDGEGSDEANPTHVYTEPGVYDVSLAVSGPTGIAGQSRPGIILVGPGRLGGACATDAQCGDLDCICGDGQSCSPGVAMCAADCAGEPCAQGVCVDLDAAAPTAPQDWQRDLCLVECADQADCPAGLTCQALPTPDSGWVMACFAPGVLGAIGDACAGPDGAPDHAACASGQCASLGARGVCASPCAVTDDCPASSACAEFAGATPSLCIARCDGPEACTADPWLGCEPPGGSGPLDFSVDEPAAPDGYCAPKDCTTSDECGLGSQCTGGFCGP